MKELLRAKKMRLIQVEIVAHFRAALEESFLTNFPRTFGLDSFFSIVAMLLRPFFVLLRAFLTMVAYWLADRLALGSLHAGLFGWVVFPSF